MLEENKIKFRQFLKNEMLQLKFKRFIISSASKKFKIPKEEVAKQYLIARSESKKEALNRGFLYLFFGALGLFIGLSSIFSNSGYIYIISLLLGIACTLSAICLFILAIKASRDKNRLLKK